MTTQNQTPVSEYGKSTLFRFSIINDQVPAAEITKSVTITPPANAGAARTSEESSSAIATLEDLTKLNNSLYLFGEYIAANKSELQLDAVMAKDSGFNLLSTEQATLVWDYIISQVQAKEQSFLLAKCINFLRGNEVLKKLREITQAESYDTTAAESIITHAANASIGIPEAFIPKFEAAKFNKAQRFNPKQEQMLKTRQKAALAKYQKDNAESTLQEFDAIEKVYRNEYNLAYQEALADYHQALETYNTETPASEGEAVTSTPPKFEFDFPAFDIAYLISKANCFPAVNQILQNIPVNSTCAVTIEKLKAKLETVKQNAIDTYNKNIPVIPTKVVQYNGHEITVDNRPPHNSTAVQLLKLSPDHKDYSLLITHYSKNGSSKLGEIALNVPQGENTLSNDGIAKKVFETDEFVSYVVFENNIDMGNDKSISVNGNVASENGELDQDIAIEVKKDSINLFRLTDLNNNKAAQRNTNTDGDPGNEEVPLYGVKKVGILEYMRVEQEVCCYVAGEVSHIENIMAREYKEKMSKLTLREDITTEESEESEKELTKDTSSTDRYEMHKEIAQAISKEQSQQIGVNAGVNATYSQDPWTVSVTAATNMNFTNSSSSNLNTTVGENFAKEVTQKATDRILKKVSYKRIAKMFRENEETNKHGFDNRSGNNHVTGIYRWVDKIYKNTLFNYGKRLIYEVMVPEPSKNFKYWVENTLKNSITSPTLPTPPVHPNTLIGNIADSDSTKFDWTDITRENYAYIAAAYGADVEVCPANMISVGAMLNIDPIQSREQKAKNDVVARSEKKILEIPDGYFTERAEMMYTQYTTMPYDVPTGTFQLGTSGWDITWHHTHKGIIWFGKCEKELPISVTTREVSSLAMNVIAICELTENAYKSWQQNTYRAIMEAYNKKYQAYLDTKVAYKEPEKVQAEYNYNPGKARAIEQRELKRLCIEMMTAQFGIQSAYDHYLDYTACNMGYGVNQNTDLEMHSKVIQFFEEAFEWDIMSYAFMPYFYGARDQWETLIQQKSPADPLFEAFLQSGMAKVNITVRPGYERLVFFFLDKGIIPPSKDFIPSTKDKADYYAHLLTGLTVLSDADQISCKKVRVWETRVPTDLVILQSGARPLQKNGLPCACKDGIAQDGLGTGTDEEMTQLEPYSSNYGDLIKDVKDAVVEVIGTVAAIAGGKSGDSNANSNTTTTTTPKDGSNTGTGSQTDINNTETGSGTTTDGNGNTSQEGSDTSGTTTDSTTGENTTTNP